LGWLATLARRHDPLATLLLNLMTFTACAAVNLAMEPLFAVGTIEAAVMWPSAGIALAAVMFCGPRVLPGLWLAELVVELAPDVSLLVSVGVAGASTLEPALGAWLLRRAGVRLALGSVADVSRLMVLGGFVAPLASGLVATLVFLIGGDPPAEGLVAHTVLWTLGDCAGVAVMAPFVRAWRDRPRVRRLAGWPVNALLVGHLAVLFLVFGGVLAGWLHHPTGGYLVFPIVVVIALVGGDHATTLAVAAAMVAAIVGTHFGLGPFGSAETLPEQALVAAYVATLGITAMVVLALGNALRTATQRLRAGERRARDFATAASDYLWEIDERGRFTFVSQRFVDTSGWPADRLATMTYRDLAPPGGFERALEWLATHAAPDGSYRDMEHEVRLADGRTRWMQASAIRVFDADGRPAGWRGASRDITERREAEARIAWLATRDPLTGLPNRVLFEDRLGQGLATARRERASLALMFVDLDRFKPVNDTLGHDVGDVLLQAVAQRLERALRATDTLARLGGDEFVVILEGVEASAGATQAAQKLVAALEAPFSIGDHALSIGCTIGIALFPRDAGDPVNLLKRADRAMYAAKAAGRGRWMLFEPSMEHDTDGTERTAQPAEGRAAPRASNGG
jgi:diguanylate cyclase (GGDEF)-like protein/PAS domain S-box-containing protein